MEFLCYNGEDRQVSTIFTPRSLEAETIARQQLAKEIKVEKSNSDVKETESETSNGEKDGSKACLFPASPWFVGTLLIPTPQSEE